MKKVNIPTSQMGKFAGKWVVIDPVKDQIIAVGETLEEISHLVTHAASDKRQAGTQTVGVHLGGGMPLPLRVTHHSGKERRNPHKKIYL